MLEALEDRCVPSTFAVTSAEDDVAERGTLRYAVSNADSGDTILIAADLKHTPIVLTHGELVLNKNVAIRGVGNVAETVSGGGTARVFEVAAGATVIIDNLVLTGGNGLANNPSGTSSLDLNGGAILNLGTLTVCDSTLTGNSSYNGGGIGNIGGTVMVNDDTLSGNSATQGGALATFGGMMTVSGSTLFNNRVVGVGGAIENAGRTTVRDSFLSSNSAPYSGGGGIFNDIHGDLQVQRSYLSHNAALNGGGIYNVYSQTVTISDSALDHNTADNDGGGIGNVGTMTVSHSRLSYNSAGSDGGGIANEGILMINEGSTLSNDCATGDGGGIYSHRFIGDPVNPTVTISGSILFDNTAAYGGGVFNDVSASLIVTSDILIDNHATHDGGGIYNNGGTVEVANSLFIMDSPDNIVGGFTDHGGNVFF